MKTILRFFRSTFLIGFLIGTVALNSAIFPAYAAISQLEEAPGQLVYQSRQTLNDQQGNRWQAIAFKRTHLGKTVAIHLRLVGFPGTAVLDHAQPLTLTNSLGKTLTAADVSQAMFADTAQANPSTAEYNLQPILMELELGMPLRLSIPTLNSAEIALYISPAVVEEWQSLAAQVEPGPL